MSSNIQKRRFCQNCCVSVYFTHRGKFVINYYCIILNTDNYIRFSYLIMEPASAVNLDNISDYYLWVRIIAISK